MATLHLDLSEQEVERIAGFLGYGNPCGSVWFIGIEEGLGGATLDDAIKNLKARGKFEKEIMDLREAHHKRLRDKRGPIDWDVSPPWAPPWQWMAKIMRAYEGERDWNDKSSANKYVQACLGRSGGATFLTELSPIPSKKAADNEFRQALEGLHPALNKKIEDRRNSLIRLLEESRPAMVICYGDGQVKTREFAEFFGVEWESVGNSIRRDPARPYPFILVPFFGLGKMKAAVIEEMLGLRLLPGQGTMSK